MDSREKTFLLGFLILGIVPVFAKHLAVGLTEALMLLGIIIATSAAFSKSS